MSQTENKNKNKKKNKKKRDNTRPNPNLSERTVEHTRDMTPLLYYSVCMPSISRLAISLYYYYYYYYYGVL